MTGIQALTLKELKRILEGMPGGHLHMYAEAKDKANWLKSRNDLRMKLAWEEVDQLAEQLLSEPIEPLLYSEFRMFAESGDRGTFEARYFKRRTRMSVFTLLWLTTEEEKYRIALEDALWAVCDEYTWVLPAHVGLYHPEYPNKIWDQPAPPRETIDLFAAETCFALAEIIHLMDGKLSPWVECRIQAEIERRIFQVFFHDSKPQNWEMKVNNWPAVCAAGIGSAALYMERDPERLAGMLWRVLASFKNHLSGFDEEGATAEGMGYWQFGFGYYAVFAELLRQRTDGQVDLLADEHVRKIAEFPNACLLAGGKTVNFSDSAEDIQLQLGLFARLHKRFPEVVVPAQPFRLAETRRSFATAGRGMLWTIESEATSISVPLKAVHDDYYFAGHQWLICHSRSEQGKVVFAAKGGHNEEPHNHNDLGHFIIHAEGKNIFADLGGGRYTRQYFQPAYRYLEFTAGSHGHSVPILGGCHQSVGRDYHADVLSYERSEELVRLQLDLAKAYDCPELGSFTRELIWERPAASSGGCFRLKLRDEISWSAEAGEIEEVFIVSLPAVNVAAGHLQAGPIALRYDAEKFTYEVQTLSITGMDRNVRTYYRLVFTAVEQAQRTVFEMSFNIGE